jgi:hemoglobin
MPGGREPYNGGMEKAVPTLYEWLGGEEKLAQVIARFYEKVPEDALLRPLFASMPKEHFRHVALFIGEVLGGPKRYSEEHGGHAAMIRHHLGKGITDEQRKRWMTLLLETADELGMPADPEFRSALVAYLEWGSRLAVINSALPKDAEVGDAPMPEWGWGVPGGPYQGE